MSKRPTRPHPVAILGLVVGAAVGVVGLILDLNEGGNAGSLLVLLGMVVMSVTSLTNYARFRRRDDDE